MNRQRLIEIFAYPFSGNVKEDIAQRGFKYSAQKSVKSGLMFAVGVVVLALIASVVFHLGGAFGDLLMNLEKEVM